MVVRTALVLAVVVMVNYLGANFFRRFYLSSQAQQLSTRTLSVVRSITNHVNVTVYFDTKDEENFYPTILALLNEYHSANPKISVRTVDWCATRARRRRSRSNTNWDPRRTRTW